MNEMINCIVLSVLSTFNHRTNHAEPTCCSLWTDIQILGSKERTQEECFFHTFKCIFTSTRRSAPVRSRTAPPNQVPGLGGGLALAFPAGSLIADIQPPDLETKIW